MVSVIAYLGGWGYWLWTVYRLHQILAESQPNYPVSPRKAVAYQFIPFYALIWKFQWPNRVADFVRQTAPSVGMRKGWVGFWLLFATFLCLIDRGLELALLFAISAYLAKKIHRVLAAQHWAVGLTTFAAVPYVADQSVLDQTATAAVPSPRASFAAPPEVRPGLGRLSPGSARRVIASVWDFKIPREWKLPIGSGIGAAFGFLMCHGIWLLLDAIGQGNTMWQRLTTEAVKILVVATVLYFFLEHITELLLREIEHSGHEHRDEKKLWPRIFRFAVFVAIVSVAHSLLDRAADEGVFQVARLGILLTFFFGGITYLWILGASKRLLRNALALVGPGAVVLLMVGMVAVADAGNMLADAGQVIDDPRQAITDAGQAIADAGQAITDPGKVAAEAGLVVAGATHSEANCKVERRLQNPNPLGNPPQWAEEVGREIPNSQNRIDGALVLASALFVALGGFAAMRKKLGPVGLAGTVFAASLVAGMVLFLTPSTLDKTHIVLALWCAFWWCLGILAFYDHDIFQPPAEIPLDPQAGPRPKDQHFPLGAWVGSSLILIGLILAAYYSYRPLLTVTADNKQRAYGAADPALTFNMGSPARGDVVESTLSPALCSPAAKGSPPDKYPIYIRPGSGEVKGKKHTYRLHFVNGSLTVIPALASARLVSSASPAVANLPVTFTAAIVPEAEGTPGGTVSFYADEHLLGTGMLSNQMASYTTSGLPLGAHLIKATYSGDANFLRTNSTLMQQIIAPEAPRRVPLKIPPMVRSLVVIPQGTAIHIANVETIDSSRIGLHQPVMAMLADPLVAGGQVLARRGAMAILGLADNGAKGRSGGTLTIRLIRLEIAGQIYELGSKTQLQDAVRGASGQIYLRAPTILTFSVESPITTDVPTSAPPVSRSSAR